jgi:GxxExxY protein
VRRGEEMGIEERDKLLERELTERILGCAIEVHREIGPGLLESVYEEALAIECGLQGLAFQRQLMIPLVYKGSLLTMPHRIDMLVENRVVLELKCVESPVLKNGIRRMVL